MRVAVVLAAVAVVAGCTASGTAVPSPTAFARGDRPMAPLAGGPLTGSGLRLLVTGDRAYLLEVDSGRRTAIEGLPSGRQYWGFVAGRRTVVAAVKPGRRDPGRFHVLDGVRARPLADGVWAFASRDGRGVWVTRTAGSRCELREFTFAGTASRPGFPVGCDEAPFADSELGLLANRNDGTMAVLSRDGGRPLSVSRDEPGWQVLGTTRRPAVALVRSVGAGGRESLALLDPATRRATPVGSPATEGRSVVAVPDPAGRLLAVRFGDPAFPGPRQYLDVWVLEIGTLRWTRLPSMPVPASIKTASMAWTPDGRLVLTGDYVMTDKVYPAESDYASMVVDWRPGERALRVRRLPVARGEIAILAPR
ncbi:hypothetical protein ACIBKY_40365 [Nonomuraea sp. NPDC050394]|uniref:hypothetical protein n=1 Tax=Nonomuraea sp. NPDC050394 TaxID=3364363 RepID=UPI0037B75857